MKNVFNKLPPGPYVFTAQDTDMDVVIIHPYYCVLDTDE